MNKNKATELDKILTSLSAELAEFISSSKGEFERTPSIEKDPILRIMALSYDVREKMYQIYPEIRADDFPPLELH